MSEEKVNHRLILTRNLMDMMTDWGLTMERIKSLLALETPTRKMERFRSEEPFPNEPEVNTRIECLRCH